MNNFSLPNPGRRQGRYISAIIELLKKYLRKYPIVYGKEKNSFLQKKDPTDMKPVIRASNRSQK